MNLTIACFSGTGNAADAARVIRDRLVELGETARLHSIEDGPLVSSGELVLVFPVYAWLPPSLVMRWIGSIPRPRASTPAAVLAVDGGGGAGAAAVARMALARRGFDVRCSARAGYPENWRQMAPPTPPERQPAMVEAGRSAAASLADDFFEGRRRHYRRPLLAVALGLVGVLFQAFGRRLLGQCYVADDRCTSCRLCERTCPVAAIRMVGESSPRPMWSISCESCNRCINICPESAIGTSVLRTVATLALCAAFGVLTARWAIIAATAIAGTLPGPVRAAVATLGVLVGQWAYLFTAAPLVRAALASAGLRRLGERTINVAWPRYTAPGFRAPIHSDRRGGRAGRSGGTGR